MLRAQRSSGTLLYSVRTAYRLRTAYCVPRTTQSCLPTVLPACLPACLLHLGLCIYLSACLCISRCHCSASPSALPSPPTHSLRASSSYWTYLHCHLQCLRFHQTRLAALNRPCLGSQFGTSTCLSRQTNTRLRVAHDNAAESPRLLPLVPSRACNTFCQAQLAHHAHDTHSLGRIANPIRRHRDALISTNHPTSELLDTSNPPAPYA
ncbi:hypothetical protein EV126DRAFT_223046 [Verticillium dahliae]|nr:hypothetical protein EV126DRAFT_223046 [Verticillium dahliae]